MDTAVLTPLRIFALPQHLIIPLFQRPYVWDLDRQWQPLWADVRRITERRLAQPWSDATHFLGAVVLQAIDNPTGQLGARAIIDGQQRLTTLQLLIDATAASFEEREFDSLAAQLEALAHNPEAFVTDGNSLKMRHNNRDARPFFEVMLADPPVSYDALTDGQSLLAQAHRYFSSAVTAWLGEDTEAARTRATALSGVLTSGLQLVVIDLRKDENSQEIFETLNARGTPLTAADLIKNFVFQRLATEGVAEPAYATLWPFESVFWERELSVGRYPISRSSLFLNQWLISRIGEEVGPTSTFTRFKDYVEHDVNETMTELLTTIGEQAALYRCWTERAGDAYANLDVVEMCVYRTQALQSEVLKPFLLLLHDSDRGVPAKARDVAVVDVESWVARRSLLRLTSGDLGRVVADLIASLRHAPGDEIAERTRSYLGSLSSTSTFWPGDDEVREGLRTESAYRRFARARLRMYLEATEDHLRGYTTAHPKAGTRVPRTGYTIEHLLPQRWRAHWPVAEESLEAERDRHVHRLGNLTLLTTSLNSAVSNGAWLGSRGKRAKLEEHDVFLMNREVRRAGENEWDETLIDARTDAVVDALVRTWPVPEGHQGRAIDTPSAVEPSALSLRDLIADGLVTPGTRLLARSGPWGEVHCEVLPDSTLRLGSNTFTSLSAAGYNLKGNAVNGWWFWSMPDGRKMKDLRAELARRNSSADVGVPR